MVLKQTEELDGNSNIEEISLANKINKTEETALKTQEIIENLIIFANSQGKYTGEERRKKEINSYKEIRTIFDEGDLFDIEFERKIKENKRKKEFNLS